MPREKKLYLLVEWLQANQLLLATIRPKMKEKRLEEQLEMNRAEFRPNITGWWINSMRWCRWVSFLFRNGSDVVSRENPVYVVCWMSSVVFRFVAHFLLIIYLILLWQSHSFIFIFVLLIILIIVLGILS